MDATPTKGHTKLIVNVASTLSLTHLARKKALKTANPQLAQQLVDAADTVSSALVLNLNDQTTALPPEVAQRVTFLMENYK